MQNEKKIKKSFGLDKTSYELLKSNQEHLRNALKNDCARVLSAMFEEALNLYYETITERLEPYNDPYIKRQTIYLSNYDNARFNELIIKYNYKPIELVNLIIRNVYA